MLQLRSVNRNEITVTFNHCHDLTTPVQFLSAELHSLSPGQQFVPLLPAEINKLELERRAAAGVCSIVKIVYIIAVLSDIDTETKE